MHCLLLHNKLSKLITPTLRCLKQHTFIISPSVEQETEHRFLAEISQSYNQGVSPGKVSSEGSTGEGSTSKLNQLLLARFSSSQAVELEPVFPQAVGHRLPLAPSYMGFSNTATCVIQVFKPRWQWRESANNSKVTILWNLVREAKFPHLCPLLLIRCWSQVYPLRRVTQWCEYEEVGIIGAIWKTACHMQCNTFWFGGRDEQQSDCQKSSSRNYYWKCMLNMQAHFSSEAYGQTIWLRSLPTLKYTLW